MLSIEKKIPIDPLYFGTIVPDRVFVEYNGPRIFTFIHKTKLYFAYMCDEDDDGLKSRYIIVPFSQILLSRLLAGESSLSDVIGQPWGWVIDCCNGDEVESIYEIEPFHLPSVYRPNRGALLPGTRKCDLSYKLLGEELTNNSVPLSALKYAADRATASIKSLSKYVESRILRSQDELDAKSPEWLVTCVLLASLEVNINKPVLKHDDSIQMEVVSKVSELLSKAAAIIAKPELMDKFEGDPHEAVAVLSAIERLTPTGRSCVNEVQLGGRIFSDTSVRYVTLSKELRPKILSVRKKHLALLGTEQPIGMQWPQEIRAIGVINYPSFEPPTFYLNNISSVITFDDGEEVQENEWIYGDAILFGYYQNWKATVSRAFDSKRKVAVIGRITNSITLPPGTQAAYPMPQYQVIKIEAPSGLFNSANEIAS